MSVVRNNHFTCECGKTTNIKSIGEIITFNVDEDKPKIPIEDIIKMKEILDKFNTGIPTISLGELKETCDNLVHPPRIGDDPSNTAARFNAGKPQISYPLSTGVALDGVARVMEFGAKKYDRDNWKKGLSPTSILDSMARHISAYLDGEYIDPDSGLPHIDHISCNALFLGYHTDRKTQDGMKDE